MTHPSLPAPHRCPQVDGPHGEATGRRERRVFGDLFLGPVRPEDDRVVTVEMG